jgi:hypothetical protein
MLTPPRIDGSAVVASVVSRMERIESLLSSQAQDIAALSRNQSYQSHVGSGPVSMPMSDTVSSPSVKNFPTDSQSPRLDFGEHVDLPPLTIPPKHRTSTNRLLALPQVVSLIGEFPEDYFYQVEARRPLSLGLLSGTWSPSQVRLPSLDRQVTDGLIGIFFSEIH